MPKVNDRKEDGWFYYQIWCSIHDQHPSECFELHYPNSLGPSQGGGANVAEAGN